MTIGKSLHPFLLIWEVEARTNRSASCRKSAAVASACAKQKDDLIGEGAAGLFYKITTVIG
jgi:hypothetical protein